MFSVSRFAPSTSLRSVSVLVASVPAVGFCGSRCGFVSPAAEVAFASLCAVLPGGLPLFVGDARGVDSSVRALFPAAGVFRVSGSGRSAFAARSVRFIRVLAVRRGLLVGFPGAACPLGLRASADAGQCFCGLGSGSWASVAFALGLGCPVLVWVPESSWVPRSFGLEPLGSGWFAALPF